MKLLGLLAVSGILAANASSINKKARCGEYYGVNCLGSKYGDCCSEYGFCGSTDAYCGTGCQDGWGDCWDDSDDDTTTTTTTSSVAHSSTRTSSSASPSSTPLTISKSARCGTGFGFTCQGSKFGNCCSQYSYCGSSIDYCDANTCQRGFGQCNPLPSSRSSFTKSSTRSSFTLSTSTRSSPSSSSKASSSSSSSTSSSITHTTTTTTSSSSSTSSSPSSSSTCLAYGAQCDSTSDSRCCNGNCVADPDNLMPTCSQTASPSPTTSSSSSSSPASSSSSISSTSSSLSSSSSSTSSSLSSSSSSTSSSASATPSAVAPFCLKVQASNSFYNNYFVTYSLGGSALQLHQTPDFDYLFTLSATNQLVTAGIVPQVVATRTNGGTNIQLYSYTVTTSQYPETCAISSGQLQCTLTRATGYNYFTVSDAQTGIYVSNSNTQTAYTTATLLVLYGTDCGISSSGSTSLSSTTATSTASSSASSTPSSTPTSSSTSSVTSSSSTSSSAAAAPSNAAAQPFCIKVLTGPFNTYFVVYSTDGNGLILQQFLGGSSLYNLRPDGTLVTTTGLTIADIGFNMGVSALGTFSQPASNQAPEICQITSGNGLSCYSEGSPTDTYFFSSTSEAVYVGANPTQPGYYPMTLGVFYGSDCALQGGK